MIGDYILDHVFLSFFGSEYRIISQFAEQGRVLKDDGSLALKVGNIEL